MLGTRAEGVPLILRAADLCFSKTMYFCVWCTCESSLTCVRHKGRQVFCVDSRVETCARLFWLLRDLRGILLAFKSLEQSTSHWGMQCHCGSNSRCAGGQVLSGHSSCGQSCPQLFTAQSLFRGDGTPPVILALSLSVNLKVFIVLFEQILGKSGWVGVIYISSVLSTVSFLN